MFVPMLLTFVVENEVDMSATLAEANFEEMCEAVLTTLSNLAVLPNWHLEFCPFLPSVFKLLEKDSLPIQLQTLKLLVNLSTSTELQVLGALLGSPAPTRLLYMLSAESHVEVLLRLVTLVANLEIGRAHV